MRKFIFILFVLMATIPLAHAEIDNSVRDLATQAMFDYGKKLYARHDYREATHVFKRILAYDPHNAGALAYLNKMCPPALVNKPLIVQVRKSFVPKPVPVQIPVSVVNPDPNADLKEEIAAEDRVLNELKEEIRRLQLENNT